MSSVRITAITNYWLSLSFFVSWEETSDLFLLQAKQHMGSNMRDASFSLATAKYAAHPSDIT